MQKLKTPNKLIFLSAATYVIVTGLSFMFAKLALSAANPVDTLAHRFTAAFITVLILISTRLAKINLPWRKVKKILPLALFYPLLFFGFQTSGLLYATSAEGGIITAASPVLTLFLANLFLKERSSAGQSVSIAISVAGVIFVAVMKGSTLNIANILGIALLAMSAISLAGYNVLGRLVTQKFSAFELSAVMITISFICYNAIALTQHAFNGTLSAFAAPLRNPVFLLSILYLGILSSLLTSLTTNFMLSHIEAARVGVLANLATVISIVAGVVFLREPFHYYHLIGSALIVGGVFGANHLRKRNQNN